MKRKYESIENEPALTGCFGKIDPAEARAAATSGLPSELEQLRDNVTREPALAEIRSNQLWVTWYDDRSRRCSWSGNLAVTLLAGLIGGLFAVISAIFFIEKHGLFAMTYVVIGAPIVEELLKQSGMIYLLEMKPYRIRTAVQIFIAAIVAALVFSTLENLIYFISFKANHVRNIEQIMLFRLTFCTALHIVCCILSSFGLMYAWGIHRRLGREFHLADAFPGFMIAMVVHSLYNLTVSFIRF